MCAGPRRRAREVGFLSVRVSSPDFRVALRQEQAALVESGEW